MTEALPWRAATAIKVALPLEARARVGLFGWGILMPLCALLAVGATLLPFGLMSGPSEGETLLHYLGSLGLCLLMVAMAIAFNGAFFSLLIDRFWLGRCLRITEKAITDARLSGATIKFQDVVSAQIMLARSGPAAVRLAMKAPIKIYQNPFRLGTITFPRICSENEVHIPLLSLDVAPRTLALVIVRVASAHGAIIKRHYPSWTHFE